MTDEVGDIAEVTFHPQEWVRHAGDEYAEPAADRDSASFFVPVEDATDENGEPLPDDTRESDLLREHEHAPEWVQSWDGPFYVTVDYGIDATALLDGGEVPGYMEWVEAHVFGGDE